VRVIARSFGTFIVASLWLTLQVNAQTITVMAQENPPFNTAKDGTARGASTDLLLRMAEISGIPLKREDISTYPWARSYEAAKSKPGSILTPVVRNKEMQPGIQSSLQKALDQMKASGEFAKILGVYLK